MKHILTALIAFLFIVPSAFAQSRSFDITANAVWLDPTGGGEFEDLSDPADIDIDADLGYGVAANIFFSDRLSAEFAIAQIEPETTFRRRLVGGPAPAGDLQIMPVTAVLQFHFAPEGFIDPYIGAGAAYVVYDFSPSEGVRTIDQIDFDDDVGLAVNAGLGIRLGANFAINVDAKYVPIETDATAVVVGTSGETTGRFNVSPIILSAGLSLRF